MAQVKKVRNLQSAFDAFERISRTPGRADISMLELQVLIWNPAISLTVFESIWKQQW